jgi:hypothetical protein
MNESEPDKKPLFETLKDTPPRDAHASARGRAHFISQIANFELVSISGKKRHNWWNANSRKERFAMNLMIALIVTFVLALGGGGTVYASQTALPNEPLYNVKTFSEDVHIAMTGNAQSEVNLLMQLTQTRVNEIAALVAQGQVPPEKVNLRLENQIEQALQIAAGMENDVIVGILQQIQAQIQNEARWMTELQNQAHGEAQQVVAQTCTMLLLRIRLMEDGIRDPQGFRNTMQTRAQNRFRQTQEPGINVSKTPVPGGNKNGPAYGNPQNNGERNGQGGPNSSITPNAGGNGPADSTPQNPLNGEGIPNPSITPGAGGGQVPSPSCTPAGDGPYGTPGGQGGNRP